jgi:hypothetical protein
MTGRSYNARKVNAASAPAWHICGVDAIRSSQGNPGTAVVLCLCYAGVISTPERNKMGCGFIK